MIHRFHNADKRSRLDAELFSTSPSLRMRPVPDNILPRFEVAEILNLQAVRDEARQRRSV